VFSLRHRASEEEHPKRAVAHAHCDHYATMASDVSSRPAPVEDGLRSLLEQNTIKARALFASAPSSTSQHKRVRLDPALMAASESDLDKSIISVRLQSEYKDLQTLPEAIASKLPAPGVRRKQARKTGEAPATASEEQSRKLVEEVAEAKSAGKAGSGAQMNALVLSQRRVNGGQPLNQNGEQLGSTALIRRQDIPQQVKPDWHAPWKLMRVISGHLGWVRALAVEPQNQWFASGAGDRVIKIWDMATGSLRLTLTGHISTVRGLAVSPRHPYLFSCGEDKMVKCWDLESNTVIRHYHGHLSGVYTLALHPTLDVLVTGGRDGVARVWDMRTRSNIHVLSGHTGTVADLKCQEADPQVITGSLDSTVRMWDLAAGKTMGVLTHHKKGVRALATHPTEFTFASGSTNSIKQWKCPEGAFMQNFEGHNAIINTLAVNEENVFFSGGDNGSMSFWDWKSGYRFQAMDTLAQPGSLDAESGIMSSTFDRTGLRLITGESDKTIKVWRPDPEATPESHPLTWTPSLARRKF
jgi:pleiotropic regulator 1